MDMICLGDAAASFGRFGVNVPLYQGHMFEVIGKDSRGQ
jgi:hypothetical protein